MYLVCKDEERGEDEDEWVDGLVGDEGVREGTEDVRDEDAEAAAEREDVGSDGGRDHAVHKPVPVPVQEDRRDAVVHARVLVLPEVLEALWAHVLLFR